MADKVESTAVTQESEISLIAFQLQIIMNLIGVTMLSLVSIHHNLTLQITAVVIEKRGGVL